jgi:hypothetical protein
MAQNNEVQPYMVRPIDRKRQRVTITIRDAYVLYPNFSGKEGKFNRAGDRNFSVMLSEEDGLALRELGWTTVKPMKRRDDDEEQYYQLPVAVRFENYPPRIWLIGSEQRTMLTEELLMFLDQLEFTKIDMTISGSDWNINGNTGRKAYLQTAMFNLYEDELEKEYGVVQGIAGSGDQKLALPAAPAYDFEGDVVSSVDLD